MPAMVKARPEKIVGKLSHFDNNGGYFFSQENLNIKHNYQLCSMLEIFLYFGTVIAYVKMYRCSVYPGHE
jgi:hypothetical protein